MLLERFYDAPLAQASYLLGCQATGTAIVVDPNRNISQYIDAAARAGLRIAHVTETHIHADFVSGSRELAARTGAELMLSDEGDADWKYAFAAESGATLLRDGDMFMVGNLRFDVMHTPGHTPEHLIFMVTDTPAQAGPMGLLTGDFLFVGDVGRPDLLERAAQLHGTMEAGARTLYRSLQRIRSLPAHLQLWPGHGSGSACGKALGAVPSSTLGYELQANWGLTTTNEDEFVASVLAGQPEPPRYFAEMKRINKRGPARLGDRLVPLRRDVNALRRLLDSGTRVLDLRTAHAYASAFVPGTINIPFNRAFTTWTGWLLPYDRDIHLIVDAVAHEEAVQDAMRSLALIGLDRVAGYFTSDVIEAWREMGGATGQMPQLSPVDVQARLQQQAVHVLDVRAESEWKGGHIAGATHIALGALADAATTLAVDLPIVVHCQSGARSAIACSLLRAHGITSVSNMAGGMAAWREAGLPVATPSPNAAAAEAA